MTETPKPTPDQEHAKKQDATLRDLFKKHGIEPPAITPEQAAAQGAPPEETKLEETKLPEGTKLPSQGPKPEAKTEDKPAKAAAATDGDKKKTPEYEKALQALRRAKTPSKVISTLDDDGLIAWGTELAKIQAEVDRVGTERAELLKKQGQPAGEQKPEGAQKGAPQKAAESPREGQPVDLKAVVKPLLEALALPDDEEGTLVSFAEAVTQPLRAQLEAQSQQFQAMNAAMERIILNETRRELGSRFPQLAEQDVFEKVTARMADLIKTGGYTSPSELMEDAAKLVIGSETPKEREPDRARTNGQMTPATRPPKVPVSRDQEEDAILRELAAGARPEDLRRKYGRF